MAEDLKRGDLVRFTRTEPRGPVLEVLEVYRMGGAVIFRYRNPETGEGGLTSAIWVEKVSSGG